MRTGGSLAKSNGAKQSLAPVLPMRNIHLNYNLGIEHHYIIDKIVS